MAAPKFEPTLFQEPMLHAFNDRINDDVEVKATVREAGGVSFGIGDKAEGHAMLVIEVHDGKATASVSQEHRPELQFILVAPWEQWKDFFAATPKRPFQSYWGMIRALGKEQGVEVVGDEMAFTKNARLWRLMLDRLRDTMNSKTASPYEYTPDDEFDDDDAISGHYTWLILPILGKCKIFYEVSGPPIAQPILFLHTAGADSRQYHSMMLDRGLREMYRMYAFDLPGHGRSFLGQHQDPLSYANSEEFYLSCIRQFLQKLNIKRAIVTGASMGGQICLAVALHTRELNVRAVIPCEACDFIPSSSGSPVYSLTGDESILNAERVCGMISPTAPEIYKRLNWWIYSSQASKIFAGDLKFYFDGWDGRERMKDLDTSVCPVYMLTGEYDYSCTPEMSQRTAEKIVKGGNARFEEMKGLGHFPFSEDPERFLPYFNRALNFVLERSKA
jgi:pimeloyl-ACP methyl ester carboxylesterase